MHQDINTFGLLYDDFIVSLMEPVQVLARKYSRDTHRVECDDLCSIGLVKVCEIAARALTTSNPCAYAIKCAENAIIDEYNRVHRLSPLSLDAPLSSADDGDSSTLADTLTSPSISPSVCPSAREAAVTSAMRRLRSRRQRAALRRSFALAGYGACDRQTMAHFLGVSVSGADSLKYRGLQSLRSDARLCAVVGVEVVG
jgi:DNA-directed RNA polymerase specialized sigma24 family protein